MTALRFANDGGPLIALDAALAAQWTGNRSPDYRDPIPPGSDYERACNAGFPADLLKIGDSTGVVIGAQEGISTAWWYPLAGDVLCLVGSVFGDQASDAQLTRMLGDDRSGDWQHLGAFTVQSGQVLLMHAASEGALVTIDPATSHAAIEDAVSASLPMGTYRLACREVSLEGRGLYTVVHWRPSARAA